MGTVPETASSNEAADEARTTDTQEARASEEEEAEAHKDRDDAHVEDVGTYRSDATISHPQRLNDQYDG